MSEKMRRESIGEAGCRLILLNFRNREISYFCKYRSPEATLNGIISFRFPVKPVAKNGVGVDEKASFHSGRVGLPCTEQGLGILLGCVNVAVPSVPQGFCPPVSPMVSLSQRVPKAAWDTARACKAMPGQSGHMSTCYFLLLKTHLETCRWHVVRGWQAIK